MATKPLPMIPRKHIDAHGHVMLWDVVGPLDDEKNGTGPVKVQFTGILAREALQRDPDRYKLDLPRGIKPGPAQDEADERDRELAAEAEAEANKDPVYGAPR